MKKRIMLEPRCPECYSRKAHIIITKRGFSVDRAVTGALIGCFSGGDWLGPSLLLGIDGREKACYLQCDVCGHVWAEK